jgi:hypothetical protein
MLGSEEENVVKESWRVGAGEVALKWAKQVAPSWGKYEEAVASKHV